MFFRIGRAFAKTSKYSTPQATKESAEVEYQKIIKILDDESYYKPENISKIIQNYFLLHSNSLKLGKNSNWASDSVLSFSFEKVFSIIDSLRPDQIFLLISNLGILRIKNSKYWEILEEKFIKNISSINIKNLPSYAMSFSQAKISNTKLWELIEQKIMTDVYPSYQFKSKGVCNLYKAFWSSKLGSDDLYQKLEENAKDILDELEDKDLVRILVVHSSRNKISPDFLELSMKKIANSVDSFDEGMKFSVLEISVTLAAQEKYIIFFEKHVEERLDNMKISDFVMLVNCYGKLGKGRRTQERKDFVAKLEENYMKRRNELLKMIKFNPVFREVRIFWGFAKNDVCSNEEIWKSYLGELAKANRDEINSFLKSPVEELEEFGRRKKLIS